MRRRRRHLYHTQARGIADKERILAEKAAAKAAKEAAKAELAKFESLVADERRMRERVVEANALDARLDASEAEQDARERAEGAAERRLLQRRVLLLGEQLLELRPVRGRRGEAAVAGRARREDATLEG